MQMHTPEQKQLLEQLQHIAAGLGQTLAPFGEVVLHDLCDPEHTVLAIHNNLSGREVGDPATELGLARIADPDFAQVVANYPNRFPDGRQAKSTSIGIKDSQGNYIAALCMNIDLTLFQGLQNLLGQFGSMNTSAGIKETLSTAGSDTIRAYIDTFAARHATTPRALSADQRRMLMRELREAGLTEMRRAMETVAAHLGVSRAAVYNYAK
ncbi:helix-turn-helix transcriptional regulator [Massilia endophytica]|uniref:helix-turn-helix transcriptional regulator n=1 Tax=Massilia endophytica TaxID=2899220 RepID=UPI001E4CE495|nr:PAS domain-containing protein [Massilia endophytica]UGQ49277.1 PAS domain-containing protein [Massilia endophytica]